MTVASVLFAVLFAFLIFVFSVIIFSKLKKQNFKKFEPKASVIIPAYNEEKNIKECLDSVFASNYDIKKLEIIVVDDGSTDRTRDIVKKYKNVELLNQNHLGKVEAMNLGAKKSRHEFIVSLDADTTLEKDCIKELLKPFLDKKVGATTGNNNVKNKKSFLSVFQNIEYQHSNLIRNSFSNLFNNGIWFSGSLACYRKEALEKINYFKKDTLAEDQDVALELRHSGYKTINPTNALGYTVVPEKLKDLYRQRSRWWIGTLQSIVKNKSLFSRKSSTSIKFLYINQFWWSFYALLSLPLIIYQVNYWLPYNIETSGQTFTYLFRWFTLLGPAYVLYKIPEYGISLYSIFGVLAGVITTIISIWAIKSFKDKVNIRSLLAIFFYFPYTIVLNIIILVSLLKNRFWSKSYYIK